MKRVYVLRTPWLTDRVFDLLKRLLGAFMVDPLLIEKEQPDADHAPLLPEDLLFVLIDDALDGDPIACAAIAKVAASGARVVGVWPPGHADDGVPSILLRNGAGLVTCDAAGLGLLLGAHEEPVWLGPDGKTRAIQPLKRGGC